MADQVDEIKKRKYQETSKFSVKIPLNFDPLPSHISFLRGKLFGPQGSYLKHIQTATGTRVKLRGKGSGYFEVTEPKEKQEAMHLFVEGNDEEAVREARQLCEDLIATAREEYANYASYPVSYPASYTNYPASYPTNYPAVNPQNPPSYPQYTPYNPTPQQYYAMQQAYAQYCAQLNAQNSKTG